VLAPAPRIGKLVSGRRSITVGAHLVASRVGVRTLRTSVRTFGFTAVLASALDTCALRLVFVTSLFD